MKLINNGESFEIQYNGLDYVIPEGEMEVSTAELGTFIQSKAKRWGRSITLIEAGNIVSIQGSVKSAKKEEIKKEVSETPKMIEPEVKEEKKTKKIKSSEKIQEIEASL